MRRLAAGLAAAALAAAGCGHGSAPRPRPSPTPTASPTPTPTRAAQPTSPVRTPLDRLHALLDRRAAALESGRVRAYAATATGSQRARDRRAARRARSIPLRDVRLRIRAADLSATRASVRVAAFWGIRGVRGTFVSDRRLIAVRRAGGWRISRASGGRGALPWELGDYVARRVPHFLVLAPRALDVAAGDLPAALAEGYARVGRALPAAQLRGRYLVTVAPTAAEARRLTVHISGVEGLTAISDTAVEQAGPARRVMRIASQRLFVIWPAFAGLGAEDRRRVVAHELTHAVLADRTSGRTPSWLVEGIALYISGDDRRPDVAAILAGRAGATGPLLRTAFSLRRLSGPDSLGRLGGARRTGAYAYASAAAFTLAARHGAQALLELYDLFGSEALRGDAGAGLVDRALRRVTGEGLAALERELRAGLS